MGLPFRVDYLEAQPLKLTAEHFPLACSLHDLVIHRYTTLASTALGMQPMDSGDLIEYLRNPDYLALTPMQSLLAQTEAAGDPTMPTAEHVAILTWLGVAFETWEKDFPLDEPLRSQLRRLKPLAAQLAIGDPDFLVPGRHPLHQILDSLQLAAVGWQDRLGKIGESVRKQVVSAVEDVLARLESAEPRLGELAAEVLTATERDLARANRMAQRAIETEQGRIKTIRAKRDAAAMINDALERFQAPDTVGIFLRGPWYESAQLVLLKFGAPSNEWSQLSATTNTLLKSLQVPEEEEDPVRRQHFFEIVTSLPKELKRWLLSLQHDGDAIADAIGLVEYTHMKLLRKQPVQLKLQEPISMPGPEDTREVQQTARSAREGQWFAMRRDNDEPLRVRLILRIEDTGELLFVNHAGLRVLRQSPREFTRLLDAGRVSPLDTGASFSRSLARAAGVETVTDLSTLVDSAIKPVTTGAGQRPQVAAADTRGETIRREPQALKAAQPVSGETGQSPASGEVQTAKVEVVGLPAGTWLGFHDGDSPLLAKLARHDREHNNYIFVNRNGTTTRQLRGEDFVALIRQGLVDILETRPAPENLIIQAKQQSAD
ncbi:MAG: DUF1631 family protein [Pseudomonadales bacterium]|nr:DUF1631 family protein [Halioglobus sp.]MCP5131971.1 DUF1631 family protein [Pseudomonadales bacterium]